MLFYYQDAESAPDTPGNVIKTVVTRMSSDGDVIADGSRPYTLPTVSGKHKDLKSISPDTVRLYVHERILYFLVFNLHFIISCYSLINSHKMQIYIDTM